MPKQRFEIIGLVLVFVALAFAVHAGWFNGVLHAEPAAIEKPQGRHSFKTDFEFQLFLSEEGWKEQLGDAMRRGDFSPADFTRLDFSSPGDPSYGDDPTYEVFNPEGKIKAHSLEKSDLLYRMTGTKGARPIFNVRRFMRPNGDVAEGIFAIVPNMREEECSRVSESNHQPAIASDNRTVIDDTVSTAVPIGECFVAPDGKRYLFEVLIEEPVKQGRQP